jgi:hypothetical protein
MWMGDEIDSGGVALINNRRQERGLVLAPGEMRPDGHVYDSLAALTGDQGASWGDDENSSKSTYISTCPSLCSTDGPEPILPGLIIICRDAASPLLFRGVRRPHGII